MKKVFLLSFVLLSLLLTSCKLMGSDPIASDATVDNLVAGDILETKDAIGAKMGIVNPKYDDYNGQGMITFSYDDGLISNYDLALPMHEKYSIPATFNIIAGRVIDPSFNEKFFDEYMLKDSSERGIEIASHGYYHNTPLTEKTDEEIYFELGESKRVLENILGKDIETIAIPFSKYDQRIEDIAREYYKGVRVYGNKNNDIDLLNKYNIYSAIAVGNTTTFEDVKVQIDDAINRKQWCIIMLHGINPNSDELNTYEITPILLEEILEYVSEKGRETILPITTKDGLELVERHKINI